MNIYPQDLGQEPCTRILQGRGLVKGLAVEARREASPYGPSFFGPVLSALGSELSFLVCMFHYNFSMGLSGLAMDVGGGGLICYGCGRFLDRIRRRRVSAKNILEQEIAFISKGEMDGLKKDYLGIVSALISLPSPPVTSQEQSIRNAVRSLGTAIEKLPAQPAAGTFVDPATLNAEAAGLTQKAGDEADPVVAASLSRQAASMRRRADTTARTAALARRNLILRQEIAEQINAFQTSIAAAGMNGSHEFPDFEALAESVAQVSQEANALADARAELDAPLTPLNTVPEMTMQRTRR